MPVARCLRCLMQGYPTADASHRHHRKQLRRPSAHQSHIEDCPCGPVHSLRPHSMRSGSFKQLLPYQASLPFCSIRRSRTRQHSQCRASGAANSTHKKITATVRPGMLGDTVALTSLTPTSTKANRTACNAQDQSPDLNQGNASRDTTGGESTRKSGLEGSRGTRRDETDTTGGDHRSDSNQVVFFTPQPADTKTGRGMAKSQQKNVACDRSGGQVQQSQEEEKSAGVGMALAVLRFYKREVSPLLPPSCRFLPTCSEYAMDAFKTYGVCRGCVLTAWRLLRCNPFGVSAQPLT
jgi:putative membrane protein insertion efficiency factor